MTYNSFAENLANKKAYINGNYVGLFTGAMFEDTAGSIYSEIYIPNENRCVYYKNSVVDVTPGANEQINYKGKAETDLAKLLENQTKILDILNVSAAMVADLEYKGCNMDTQRNAIRYYYERLFARQKDLIDAGVISNIQSGTTELTGKYGDYLEKIANNQKPLRIGVAPLVPIIIKATIIITMAVIAYMIVRSIFVESKTDLKEAQDLANIIAGMDKNTASQYMDYLKKLSGSGFMTQLKYIAIIAGVAFVAYKGLPYIIEKKGGNND